MRAVAIVNPRSGGGKAAEAWAAVRAHLRAPIETRQTARPEHAIELTAQAIRRGAAVIVAVGGDGTINEVVNGFFDGEHRIESDTVLAIVPHGTGSDFRRVLNLPGDARAMAGVIERGTARAVDVLRVRYTRSDGATAQRYAVNMTSFGMGGAVAVRATRSWKRLGGRVGFLLATLLTALSFKGDQVTVLIDDATTIESRIMNVAVGNGQYQGGGMWACPNAALDDGRFDVTVVHHLPLHDLVRSLPRLYDGSILSHPKVQSFRGTRLTATSSEPSLVEIDGEPLGRLPIEISIVPNAIRILT